MRSEESRHQSAVFDILRLNEKRHPQLKWIFAVPNGGHRNVIVAAKLKREGVKKGIADICCPVPMNGKHGLWIELKIKPNRLSPEQHDFLVAMIQNDYETQVCWSCDEVLEAIEKYLEIRLAR